MKNAMEPTAQNDIADLLYYLARFVNGTLKDFLIDLGDFFEELTSDPEAIKMQCQATNVTLPQGLFDGECLDKLTDGLKDLFLQAGLQVAEGLPGLLQNLIGCAMGSGQPQAQAGFQVNFACVWSAFMTYLRTRDITQSAAAFFACQFGGSLPPGPKPPVDGPNFRSVDRCD